MLEILSIIALIGMLGGAINSATSADENQKTIDCKTKSECYEVR